MTNVDNAVEGDLKIQVAPDPEALYKKWCWTIYEYRSDWFDNELDWYPYFSGWGHATGSTRTKEKALAKARKTAAEICEARLKRAQARRERSAATVVERVTCDGL